MSKVPAGWKIKTIADVCDVKGGKRLPKGYSLINEDTGYPYIRVTDMYDGGVSLDTIKYVPAHIAPAISKYTIGVDDIFITVAGTLGLVGEIPEKLHNANLTENADKLTNIKISKKYLLEVMRSPLIQTLINAEKTTNAQPKLALERIRSFPIYVPPLPEQRKIAKILSTWDKAIAATEALIAASEEQKRGLMQELLTGKRRFGGFEGAWRRVRLGEVVKERIEINNDDLPLLSITANEGVINREETGRKDTSNVNKSKYKKICVGDIGYNTMRMWQGVSGLSSLEGIVSPAYTVLIPKKEYCSEYLAHLFKFPDLIHVFYRYSQGLVSDTWTLKYSMLAKISWEFPSLPEQQKIAEVLSAADREIELLREKLAYLQEEKKGLMQVLLTGKRRVVVDEEEAVSV